MASGCFGGHAGAGPDVVKQRHTEAVAALTSAVERVEVGKEWQGGILPPPQRPSLPLFSALEALEAPPEGQA